MPRGVIPDGESAHITFLFHQKTAIPTLVLTNRFKGSEQPFTLSQMAPPVGFYLLFYYLYCILLIKLLQ